MEKGTHQHTRCKHNNAKHLSSWRIAKIIQWSMATNAHMRCTKKECKHIWSWRRNARARPMEIGHESTHALQTVYKQIFWNLWRNANLVHWKTGTHKKTKDAHSHTFQCQMIEVDPEHCHWTKGHESSVVEACCKTSLKQYFRITSNVFKLPADMQLVTLHRWQSHCHSKSQCVICVEDGLYQTLETGGVRASNWCMRMSNIHRGVRIVNIIAQQCTHTQHCANQMWPTCGLQT